MKRCEFCSSELPGHAGFCGTCGKSTSHITGAPTGLKAVRLAPSGEITDVDTVSLSSLPGQQGTTPATGFAPITNTIEEEDEEKRRRAALLGFALPVAGEILGGPFAGNAPTAQGTPQFGGVLSGQGTPQFAGNTPPPVANLPGSGVPGGLPTMSAPPMILPPPTSPPPYIPTVPTGPSSPPGGSQQPTPPPGCITWLIVVVLPILLLVSIFGAGLTIFAPSLSGSSNVAPGGFLHLHGQSFLPGDTVSFTLDGSQHLSPSALAAPMPRSSLALSRNTKIGQLMQVEQLSQVPGADRTITINGNGTFDVTILVGQDWHIGQHTIRASEDFSPRNASFTFRVSADGQTPTPTPTDTPTDTPTATPTASPTPSPTTGTTTGPTALSGVSPGTVALGPVSAGATQPVTKQVTLSTTGSNPIPWTATWNPNQAPWLQINPASGQIQAPGSQQITVGALPVGMAAGSYSTVVTFNSSSNNVTLNVTFIVQSACIAATPSSLTFTGVAGRSDPAAQTISLNNCGISGPWSSTITTDTGAGWLAINPSSGKLNNGSAQTVTVTASNVEQKLPPGTYQGSIVFSSGSAQATVSVTLTVASQPILTVNPSSVDTTNSTVCQIGNGVFICTVTLTSNRGTTNLDWTASSSNKNVTFSPGSGSIAPGKSATVTITIPMSDCDLASPPSLSFTGPANTVDVPVTCGVIG